MWLKRLLNQDIQHLADGGGVADNGVPGHKSFPGQSGVPGAVADNRPSKRNKLYNERLRNESKRLRKRKMLERKREWRS